MLTRQALWIPTVRKNPAFLKAFNVFAGEDNPVTRMNVVSGGIRAEESCVVLEPASNNNSEPQSLMMAFPFTIQATICDVSPVDQKKYLSAGFAAAMCDSCNSFQVMERLLPVYNAHVSVNIQTQQVRPIAEGERIVLVSTIDRMGKRLVYCKSEWFVDREVVSREVEEQEKAITTIEELKAALCLYERVLHGTHAKSIIGKCWA